MNTVHNPRIRKTVIVSQENYKELGRLGHTSETYNDVIGRLIKSASKELKNHDNNSS